MRGMWKRGSESFAKSTLERCPSRTQYMLSKYVYCKEREAFGFFKKYMYNWVESLVWCCILCQKPLHFTEFFVSTHSFKRARSKQCMLHVYIYLPEGLALYTTRSPRQYCKGLSRILLVRRTLGVLVGNTNRTSEKTGVTESKCRTATFRIWQCTIQIITNAALQKLHVFATELYMEH